MKNELFMKTYFIYFFLFLLVAYSGFTQPVCISGNCTTGTGVLNYGMNVGRYEGEFKNGKRDGIGTMYYADGRQWKGKWAKDEFKTGTTTNIPYHSKDSLQAEGTADQNPFIDAIYRIVATSSNNFEDLKGEAINQEYAQYVVYRSKVNFPNSISGEVKESSMSCRYLFGLEMAKEPADKLFSALYRSIEIANPQHTWRFDDLSDSPVFPKHYKFYKWTITNPTTIRLEMTQATQDPSKYDIWLIFTP